jgi:hypothetical protein
MSDPVTNHLEQVDKLHKAFETLTGNRCTLSYMRIAAWHEFIRRGFDEASLEGVISFIRREMARQGSGYSPASLQFSRLIQDTDLFEDRLNLARQAWRAGRPARPITVERTQHVGNISRAVELPAPDDAIPIADAMAELQAGRERLRNR